MEDFLVLLKQLWIVWFFVLFVGVVVWVYWPTRREGLEQQATIPLRDDDPPPAARSKG
ncbi:MULTISPECIES: CcoQ/FixQ family Cbb3-type cytochrome c oxidase assembly chaperone [Rhodospirillales]|uniref:Cytochrome c oxidase, Cbb3-type, subunit IV n=2 Tax=Rhodospirillales TaxID=204441 RepID=B6IT14_RHOCS|nr:CcoQ/FixQ family Cbb3-type cytochrome c oxidase assembly chaperone [Rhodospirillum centenum]ACI98685.1 cytochrome c oxidase, Cbb3-type, subunit IV [Rhodospirillum centenum SW]